MKPILFNGDMVRAILEGRKTVTRRVVKPKPLWRKPPIQQKDHIEYWANWDDERIYKAPYRPGDILYVRETWQHLYTPDRVYIYKADSNGREDLATNWKGEWRPSIHMPKKAARLFLRVTDVRVERLQDITDDEILAEGIQSKKEEWLRLDFADLWNSTIKSADFALYGWDASPWVWVIEFERCEKPEGS